MFSQFLDLQPFLDLYWRGQTTRERTAVLPEVGIVIGSVPFPKGLWPCPPASMFWRKGNTQAFWGILTWHWYLKAQNLIISPFQKGIHHGRSTKPPIRQHYSARWCYFCLCPPQSWHTNEVASVAEKRRLYKALTLCRLNMTIPATATSECPICQQ